MRSLAPEARIEVTELARHDLVGLARCMAIDAVAFPYPSIPLGHPAGLQTLVAKADSASAAGPPSAPAQVAGFVTSTVVAMGTTRYIHGLAVAPGTQRRGIGRALVRECVARARAAGLRFIVLHVGAANRPAVFLYSAEGFAIRRVSRGFYRPGLYASRDAFELELPL